MFRICYEVYGSPLPQDFRIIFERQIPPAKATDANTIIFSRILVFILFTS